MQTTEINAYLRKDDDGERKENSFDCVHSFPLVGIARGFASHVISRWAIGFGQPTLVLISNVFFVWAAGLTISRNDIAVRKLNHQKHFGENDQDIKNQEAQESVLDPTLRKKVVDFCTPILLTMVNDDEIMHRLSGRNSIVDVVSVDGDTGSPGAVGFHFLGWFLLGGLLGGVDF